MDGIISVPDPVNEPILGYLPKSPERIALERELLRLESGGLELTATIGGVQRFPGGESFDVVQPHAHAEVLGHSAGATTDDAVAAVDAALAAAPAWAAMPPEERAAVFLRAADLLAGPWRARLNAATMLGQGKTVQQAEIDAACELIDFLRFNVAFAQQIRSDQPTSPSGVWNRTDYRPLEGFVYAVTPFNFTAIAGNLPTAPALMGNVVVWKPSPTQMIAAHFTMRLLEAAGLPPGVINLLPGDGRAVSEVVLAHPALAGIHFTGSTPTFQYLWREVGSRIADYRTYPRVVGETGGKDFVFAHPSADVDALRVALVRGAFEYSGQKCSAASRAYVPSSVWERLADDLADTTASLVVGDPRDFTTFTGAVIDARSYARNVEALERAKATSGIRVLAGGRYDDSTGWFVSPTVLVADDPADEVFAKEYFGPILAVHVYPDADAEKMLDVVAQTSPYGLTGAVISNDRRALAHAEKQLRFAAGNFYLNDKPTGAVVGQQPFGGSRASGTNDKAGSMWNLIRWVSPRSIKETFVPATDHRYPNMS